MRWGVSTERHVEGADYNPLSIQCPARAGLPSVDQHQGPSQGGLVGIARTRCRLDATPELVCIPWPRSLRSPGRRVLARNVTVCKIIIVQDLIEKWRTASSRCESGASRYTIQSRAQRWQLIEVTIGRRFELRGRRMGDVERSERSYGRGTGSLILLCRVKAAEAGMISKTPPILRSPSYPAPGHRYIFPIGRYGMLQGSEVVWPLSARFIRDEIKSLPATPFSSRLLILIS